MSRSNQLVVVVTRSYATGVGVVRALGAAGFQVDVVASARMPGLTEFIQKSKYVREFHEAISPKFHAEGETDVNLVEELLKYRGRCKRKPVLFPTDDYTASIMDENRTALSEVFLMPGIAGGSDGSMTAAMDKDFQSRLALEAGILTPKEWTISLAEPELEIPADMVYPCFVKPIESITGYKAEMKKCLTRSELERHLLKLRSRRPNRSILVQEFLNIQQEIDLSGVCLDQEIIIPAIIKKTCVAQYEKGVTLSGMIYPFESLGGYCEKTIRMMQAFHYTGMFDMEFNVTRDGRIYFNEVNLRSGGPNYAYFKAGANLPALVVDELTDGRHLPGDAVVDRIGQNFIYEKVAWEDFLHGFMTRETLDQRMRDADFGLLYSKEDPGPYQFKLQEFNRLNRNRAIQEKKQAITERVTAMPAYQKAEAWTKKEYEQLRMHLQRYPQLQKKNQRRKFSDRTRVMVAGRNYCSNLCIARAVGEAGYDVEVAHVYQTLPGRDDRLRGIEAERYSKYVKAYYVILTMREEKTLVDELIKLADPNRKMLLIPADDLVAAVVDKFYDRLKKYYILPNVADTQGEINRLMEKGVQKELARAAGLPVLKSCVIRAERGRFVIPDTVTYPCFIKPNVSRLAAKSRMHRCDTKEELAGWLTVFSERREIEMLVEDYVEIKNELSILGVSSREGAIGPAAFIAVKGGSAEHRGVALTGRVLDLEELQPLADQLIDFVGTLNYEGLYDIDLIETEDGKIYFVEINLRLGASGYAFGKCGVNLSAMFADHMIYGKPLDRSVRVTSPGRIFVSEKVLIDEYAGGRITRSECDKLQRSASLHFIQNEDDPEPYRYFRRFFPVATALRRRSSEIKTAANIPLEERLETANTRAVNGVMKATYWSEQRTLENMDAVREKFGISYVRYYADQLYAVPFEELEAYLAEQEKTRADEEEKIVSVMAKSGWSWNIASEKMRAARKTLGASFEIYDQVNLWRLRGENQKKYFSCIQRYQCSEAEFYRYRMSVLPARRCKELFLNVDSGHLEELYNTDETFLKKLSDPESFFRTFRPYIRRAWCRSDRVTREQFAETFEGCTQVAYRPLGESEQQNVTLFNINAYNATAVYDVIAAMEPGIVEECLRQHPQLEALTPHAMAKLRIVTVSNQEAPVTEDGRHMDVAYAVLRMGMEDGQPHQFYNGEYSAVVDLGTGKLLTSAADKNCAELTAHPATGIVFEDYPVPMFEDALEVVTTAIKRGRISGYLGWDFVITERRPVLISVTASPIPVLISAPCAVLKTGIKPYMSRYLWKEQLQQAEAEAAEAERLAAEQQASLAAAVEEAPAETENTTLWRDATRMPDPKKAVKKETAKKTATKSTAKKSAAKTAAKGRSVKGTAKK